ncbi:MAG: hypothetical protein C4575_01720 [Desulforudis sp.]|jgi:predicted RNA-binding Zn-ribbon protein involved in translation (DUF1610 family)|nr:MAG: hypothetical protein C4575_01720 [Desulforudis sp.]
MFTCPKCGGELLFTAERHDTYWVDPQTGEFEHAISGEKAWFECPDCGDRFNASDPELPFRFDPDKLRAVERG